MGIDRHAELRAALEGMWRMERPRRPLLGHETEQLWDLMGRLETGVGALRECVSRTWPEKKPVGVREALRDAEESAEKLAESMVAIVARAVGNGRRNGKRKGS